MQRQFQCPRCKSPIIYGAPSCNNCGQTFKWQHQQQFPQSQTLQQQSTQTPHYQQPEIQPNAYQQQTLPAYQIVNSICVGCGSHNQHGVDHNGDAIITCPSCSTVYNVKLYLVRAKGGRRDQRSGIKAYSVRVKEPDRDETLLEFDSKHEIEMRAGDWIICSYSDGILIYLINQNIRQHWNVREGMDRKGCTTVILMIAMFITLISMSVLYLF